MPTATRKLPSGYIPTLDGWRALAICVVVFSHDKLHGLGSFSTLWIKQNGERGVELFFAISGLLICSRLLDEERRTGRIDLRGFYVRRLCRIQPAALVYLAAVGLLMLARVLDREPGEMLAALLLVRNYLPLHVSPQSWYTAHYWSLSVEEHFYLFLPGFLVLVRRNRAAVLFVLVVLLEIWRVIVLETPALQFGWLPEFHTDMAVGGILLSAGLAQTLTRPAVRAWMTRWLQPGPMAIVTVLVWTAVALRHGRWNAAASLCTYPLLLLSTVLHPDTLIGRMLESAPLRFVGRISYSLYLWQMLFFVFFPGVAPVHSAWLAFLQQTPMRYLCVLAMSLASHFWIEKPFIRLGHRLAKPVVPDRADFQQARKASDAVVTR